MELEVLHIDEKEEWNKILEVFPEDNRNIYLTPEYYESWMEYENAIPHLAVFRHEGELLLYPFFLRKINGYNLDKEYFDLFTAYGYGGVIQGSNRLPDLKLQEMFNKMFNRWVVSHNVVTEFIRETPAINSRLRWANYSLVRYNAAVLFDQDYNIPCKKTRSHVKIAKQKLHTELDSSLENIDEFIDMYRMTAKRLGFDQFYCFPDSYFYKTKELLKANAKIMFVRDADGNAKSAILFFTRDHKASFHLACSKEVEEHLNQNDMAFAETIQYCLQQQCRLTCLGGGTSPDIHDPLLRFKKKFSNVLLPVYIGKKVHNERIYGILIDEWEKRNPEQSQSYRHYFQRYNLTFQLCE